MSAPLRIRKGKLAGFWWVEFDAPDWLVRPHSFCQPFGTYDDARECAVRFLAEARRDLRG